VYDRGELMNIFIDNKSGAPIYDQIFNQIKSQIISGALKEDEALPSIRNLAKDLKISVVTTKRAYDELEREGFIYTIAAKGCFVAPKNVELIREANLRKIEELMAEIGKLAAGCGLSKKELIEMFEYITEEE
jgi:GntR family transcriptional regulator